MEKTIKNFDSFVKKLWEESSMNFLNSFSQNPIDFLDHVDDMVLEYLDDDYKFHSYFTIRKNYKDKTSYKITDGSGKTGHGWELVCSDLTFSQVKSFESKFLIFDWNDKKEFKDLVNSGNYRPIYRLVFYPNSKTQKMTEVVNEFCKPITERIKNELNSDMMYVHISSSPNHWVMDDIGDIGGNNVFGSGWISSRMSEKQKNKVDFITVHLGL